MIDVDGSVALLGAATAFVTAIGVLAKQIRDGRRERRARRQADRKTDDALEKVARAAAVGRTAVVDVVDELENTGAFQRPSAPPEGDEKP